MWQYNLPQWNVSVLILTLAFMWPFIFSYVLGWQFKVNKHLIGMGLLILAKNPGSWEVPFI